MAGFGCALFRLGGIGVERMARVKVGEQLRAVWKQAGGLAGGLAGALTLRWEPEVKPGADVRAAAAELAKRRTLALPSILTPYRGGFGVDAGIPKPTQANLRKFAET